jgi:hypothetical protein
MPIYEAFQINQFMWRRHLKVTLPYEISPAQPFRPDRRGLSIFRKVLLVRLMILKLNF